ncbi:MAG: cysteine--tRNA ligase [archaeon]
MKLYNTLSRKKETFSPLKKLVGIYSCGPTVYNFAHIGNLRTYIFSDLLKRTIEFNGNKVKHVMNITDVGHLVSDADAGEDKMMKALEREGLKPTKASMLKLANMYTKAFHKDLKELNIIEPKEWPKATEHIEEMIRLVKLLLKNGYAYETSTAVYYDISKFKDYNKLAQLSLNQLEAGARVEVDKEKKNPLDFVLWFKAVGKHSKHLMQWDSPWGKGFPGWHIECSAMASKYLGKQFDIHTGGIDHIPIHHTNEIAQSEGAFNVNPWVKYWVHGEFLVLQKEKMAKSGDNFITLDTLKKKGYDALDYRYFCLGTHYRKPLMFSYEGLDAARNGYDRLKNKVLEMLEEPDIGEEDVEEFIESFQEAINDDLNTPKALAVVWDMVKDEKVINKKKYKVLMEFDRVLGLRLDEIKVEKLPKEITLLIEKREHSRLQKHWDDADKLRDELKKKGYLIEDTSNGARWKRV